MLQLGIACTPDITTVRSLCQLWLVIGRCYDLWLCCQMGGMLVMFAGCVCVIWGQTAVVSRLCLDHMLDCSDQHLRLAALAVLFCASSCHIWPFGISGSHCVDRSGQFSISAMYDRMLGSMVLILWVSTFTECLAIGLAWCLLVSPMCCLYACHEVDKCHGAILQEGVEWSLLADLQSNDGVKCTKPCSPCTCYCVLGARPASACHHCTVAGALLRFNWIRKCFVACCKTGNLNSTTQIFNQA